MNKIASIAEVIAEDNIFNNKVDLENIAKNNNIKIIYGNYEDEFLGVLVHKSKRFYIHLNLDALSHKNSVRRNFTLAHELGHYFIKEHRDLLLNGESLSYNLNPNKSFINIIEKEANHFASNLLMPHNRFISAANSYELGLEAILNLRTQFSTSIECTSIHYIDKNLSPAMYIKWDKDLNFCNLNFNDKFSKLISTNKTPNVLINSKYVKNVIDEINKVKPKNDYLENATLLSRWISTITPKSRFDILGLEQTLKWGNYGAFTFLIFP
jgi:Zn-dependent peptidase ImmA (M78 family)